MSKQIDDNMIETKGELNFRNRVETITNPEALQMKIKKLLVETRIRVLAARENPANKQEFLGYESYKVTVESIEERAAKVEEFNNENDAWCDVWHSEACSLDRQLELSIYNEGPKQVLPLKIKCIDGRKPRPIEGEADSTKTEEAKIALDKIPSTGEIIPLQDEICNVLSDLSIEPLEISLAHYDSHDNDHGCAAIKRLMTNVDIFKDELADFLSVEEMKLLIDARDRGLDEANLILLELTNNRAFLNIRNAALRNAGLPEVKRIAVAAMFDTRTMGMELRAPLLETDPETGKINLAPIEKRQVLSTTEIATQFKSKTEQINTPEFPDFGSLENTFNTLEGFQDYSRKLTIMSAIFYSPQDHNKYLESIYNKDLNISEELKQAALAVHDAVSSFIENHYSDLPEETRRVLKYRFYRSVAHQFLTGLSEYKHHHPFSDHEEMFISTSEDGNYPGKLDAQTQSFRISAPDQKIGASRTEIAASVMDATGVDNGQPHIWYVSTSITKEDYENYLSGDKRATQIFEEAEKKNARFLRSMLRQPAIRKRFYEGNLQPVPVLVDKDTNKVLTILDEQVVYF